MSRVFSVGYLLCAVLIFSHSALASETLFYAGDPASSPLGIESESNFVQSDYSVCLLYQGFMVTDPVGWHVTDLWSTDYLFGPSFRPTEAVWSIRSGMVEGDPGILVAGGTSALIVTVTDFLGWGGKPLYSLGVPNLAVDLAPGTYWFQLSPIGRHRDDTGALVDDAAECPRTLRANAVNRSRYRVGGAYYYQISTNGHVSYYDDEQQEFSMGISGSRGAAAIPEPPALALLVTSFGAVVSRFCLRRP